LVSMAVTSFRISGSSSIINMVCLSGTHKNCNRKIGTQGTGV
jgi:hypothetical protein